MKPHYWILDRDSIFELGSDYSAAWTVSGMDAQCKVCGMKAIHRLSDGSKVLCVRIDHYRKLSDYEEDCENMAVSLVMET